METVSYNGEELEVIRFYGKLSQTNIILLPEILNTDGRELSFTELPNGDWQYTDPMNGAIYTHQDWKQLLYKYA